MTKISYHSSNKKMMMEKVEEEVSQPVFVSKADKKNLDFDEARKTFINIMENEYVGGANGKTPVQTYPCDCKFDPEQDPPNSACGEDCINRMLCIECKDDCPYGKNCSNRRFQRFEYAKLEVFKTDKKGFGVRTLEALKPNQLVIEYCGEVIPKSLFLKRTQEYSQSGMKHFYFMSLKTDEIIDAQKKGNASRFINHSCNASCELQKWTVNSRVRMGIFAKREVGAGDELTFDYKFERYGAQAQPCYCGEENCKGIIGGEKRSSVADYDEDEEDEDEMYDTVDEETAVLENTKRISKIENVEEVGNFIISLLETTKIARIKRLLRKLEATDNMSILKKFVHLQGMRALKNALTLFGKTDLPLFYQIIKLFKIIPVSTKNLITDCKVDETLYKLISDVTDPEIVETANEVMESWSSLPVLYKIPKRSKTESELEQSVSKFKRPSDDSSPRGSFSSSNEKKFKYYEDERSEKQTGSAVYSGGVYKKEVERSRSDSYSYGINGYYNSKTSESDGVYQQDPPWSRQSLSSTNSTSRRYSDNNNMFQSNMIAGSVAAAVAPPSSSSSSFSYIPTKASPTPDSSSLHSTTNLATLPPNWKATTAEDGSTYYYNTETRQTQWEPPVELVAASETTLPKVEEPIGRAIVPGLSEQNFEKIIEEANANAAAQRKLLTEAAKKTAEKRSSSSSSAAKSSGIFKKRDSSDSLSRSKSDSKRKHGSKSKSGNSSNDLPKDVLKFRRGVSEIVIKTLSKHKNEINTDLFKMLARKLTHAVVEKERRNHNNLEKVSNPIPDEMKRKIKKLVYTKLQEHGIKRDKSSDVSATVADNKDDDYEVDMALETPSPYY